MLNAPPNPATCAFGDYHYNKEAGFLYLCYSGKKHVHNQVVNVQAIACTTCAVSGERPLNRVTKKWSDKTAWLGEIIPTAGSNATILSNVSMIMDISDTPALKTLIIEGFLIPDSGDKTITAENIHINRFGKLEVGTAATPYPDKFTITLTGTR